MIAAPSAPAISFAALQEEREAQSAFAQEVFQQIQSFGESADDEFDVQWASSAIKKASEISTKADSLVFDSANAYSPDTQPNQPESINSKNESQIKKEETPQQRINPFLVPSNISHEEDEYDEEKDGIDVQQVVKFKFYKFFFSNILAT